MPNFDYEIIRVKLNNAGITIAMTIRGDYSPEDYSVVFADPIKLEVYMKEVNRGYDPVGLQSKVAAANRGILQAAILPETTDALHTLPMAKVNCLILHGKAQVSFSDGMTRTTQLLFLGAEFVPLEVSSKEAELLHKLVGNGKATVPAADFIIPSDVRIARMTEYYVNSRKKGVKYEP